MPKTLTVLSDAELDAVTGAGDQSASNSSNQQNNANNVNGSATQTNNSQQNAQNTQTVNFPPIVFVGWPF